MSMKKLLLFLTCVFLFMMITTYSNIAISATVISTHPGDGVNYVPIYQPVSVEVSDVVDPTAVSIEFNPTVNGAKSFAECDILSYYYNGIVPAYRDLASSHCYRLVFTPYIDYTPGTTYTVTVSGDGLITPYSWSFTTGDFLSVSGELEMKTYSSPLRHKSAVAMNSSGNYVVVWQESDGIKAQRFYPSGYPGTVFNVGTYYSDYHGPAIDMNENGDFVVAWKEDFFNYSQGEREIWHFVRKYEEYGQNLIPGWNSNGWNIVSTLPDYIYEHSDDYAHQIHPVGGPSVGINESGGYVIVYASPICKQVCFDLGGGGWGDPPQCNKPKFQCDNFIFGIQVSADGSSYSRFGDTNFTESGGNSLSSSYDMPMISQPPHPAYGWTSNACGSIKNSAYYPEVSMAPNGNFVVTWLEWECSEWDNIKARIFNSNGSPRTDKFQVNANRGNTVLCDEAYAASAINDNGDIAIVWSDRYRLDNPDRDWDAADIYGRLYDINGNPRPGGEFRINDETAHDQWGPNVAMGDSGEFVVTWQSNGQDAGGHGIYAKRYDASGNSFGNEFRVNLYNSIILDIEKSTLSSYPIMEPSKTVWYDKPGISMNSYGGFVVTWTNYDYEEVNMDRWGLGPATYGLGYGIYSNLYTVCTEDVNSDGVWDCMEDDDDNDGILDDGDYSGIIGDITCTEVNTINCDDNCQFIENPDQIDEDLDSLGNDCDNCPSIPNFNQDDVDGNGIGDVCDDSDADGIINDGNGNGTIGDNPCTGGNTLNCDDNCRFNQNPDQADGDSDGVGDDCDNCSSLPNFDQEDLDGNGIGDVCDDYDGDGIFNDGDGSGDDGDNPCTGGSTLNCDDNCLDTPNPDQADGDSDDVGDACDNCASVPNFNQEDTNGNGIGEACDDNDSDGIMNDGDGSGTIGDNRCTSGNTVSCDDNCINAVNPDQADYDNDTGGDACDADDDNDGLTDVEESILGTYPLDPDSDDDGVDDLNDVFPMVETETSDSDGKEIRITNDASNQTKPNISGNYIVWYDTRSGNDLYMYDISTNGPELPIDSDLMYSDYHSISGNRIIWHDIRRGNRDPDIFVYDIPSSTGNPTIIDVNTGFSPDISGGRIVGFNNSDVYIYDIPTQTEIYSNANPESDIEIAVSGDNVVWHEYDSSLKDVIYVYDILTGTKIEINSTHSGWPDVSGDLVVWQEYGDRNDLYMYRISNHETTRLTRGGSAYRPAVSGNRIVWCEDRNGSTDIYMYNVSTKDETRITTSGTAYSPAVSGNRIVWEDNRTGDYDIYMYAGDGAGDNSDNCPTVYNPDQTDLDGDDIGDVCDACPSDNNIACDQDTDDDTMMDSYELKYGLDINSDDSGLDKDEDGLTNLQEYQLNTSPTDYDSDNDSMHDGWEVDNGLNPLFDETKGDADSDELPNLYEYIYGLDPDDPYDADEDTDNDGLTNLQEYQLNTDPTDYDSDDDGMYDGWEVGNGLDPVDGTTGDEDNDGFTDLHEFENGTDPQNDESRFDNGVLLKEYFDAGNLDRWKIIDDGIESAPSLWVVNNEAIVQSSNIYGGSLDGAVPDKPGTYARKGNRNWRNYHFSFLMKSQDDAAVGAMFRYFDNDNYYRLSMDKQRSYRRLIKKTTTGVEVLAEDNFTYNQDKWYKVKIFLKEDSIKIYMAEYDGDMTINPGDLIFDINDSSIGNGMIALYSWGNSGTFFDDVLVQSYWSIHAVTGAVSVGKYASLALDANGNPHIGYSTDSWFGFEYANWTGSLWEIKPVQYENWSYIGKIPQIVVDSSGTPHMIYPKVNDTNKKDLLHAKWNGLSWDIEPVDENGSAGAYSSIALDEVSGDMHVSYYDIMYGDLKYAKWTGSYWNTYPPVDNVDDVGRHTSIALDPSGNPHISYYDNTNRDLKYAKWNGSSWDVMPPVDEAYWVGQYTSIAVDVSGNPHISYYHDTLSELRYAKWTGMAWNIQTVDAGAYVGKATSIALDSNGYPHISYYDDGNDYLKYARWTGTSWVIEIVDGRAGYDSLYTSLVLDSMDTPHISYRGYEGLKYAVGSCPYPPDPFCGRDSDNDGMPDSYELQNGYDTHDPADAGYDVDGDLFTNLQEHNAGTKPGHSDTDNDGLLDGFDNCPVYPTVRITDKNYSSLQGAYNKAVDGDTIQSQEVTFTGGININRNINVTIDGGYNCDYSTHSGETTISGDMVINSGTLIIDNGTLVVE